MGEGQYLNIEAWSIEKANDWYAKQAWPCGFNYIPANAISYTEMWMPYCFDTKLIDQELALAEGVGFNCLRVVLPFVVWEHDPQKFKETLDTFLAVSDKHGLKVMFCFFDDCNFGSDDKLDDPWYGKQPEVLDGWYANGWTPSPGHSMVRNPKTWGRLELYVKDIISSFKEDPRVWVWDLYNEPTGGGLGDISLPLVSKVFEWARSISPSQALTVGRWNGNQKLNTIVDENSDILSFHNYQDAAHLEALIRKLQTHNRPLVNTEWLNRGTGSFVSSCLPLFKKYNVGCMHWGLVNGKTQTNLGWGARPGKPKPDEWQHDIFHGDFTPHNKEEINIFKECINQ